MNVDAAWSTLTSVNSTPVQRRNVALDLLLFFARGGDSDVIDEFHIIAVCEAVIRAEFVFADKFPHK